MSQEQSKQPTEILELFEKRAGVIKPGLDRITKALDLIGYPGRDTPSIVVAGTNGKGTTSGMIWRMLSAAGAKAGLFTSPHLTEFRERICVSGVEISNTLLVERIIELKEILPDALWDELTFFEINTILAFMVFEQQKTDVNVLEIGLGGRLDSVNVYDPDVAVITSIGLDHTEYLGSTLTAVAREKAGIMRRGRPVIWCAREWVDEEADAAITASAEAVGAQLIRAEEPRLEDLPVLLRMRPFFFQRNFQLAKEALKAFLSQGKLRPSTIFDSKKICQFYDSPQAPWPVSFTGRFDLVTVTKGDYTIKIILDVCHNPHGAATLARGLRESGLLQREGKIYCLLSVLADKDAAGIWEALKGNIKDVIAFRSASDRSWESLPPKMVNDGVIDLLANFDTAWMKALSQPDWRQSMPWLLCGSVAMVGEVLDYWRKNGWLLDRKLLS
jgi:dihydrofolate synthase / folylpolyglutamate synthase